MGLFDNAAAALAGLEARVAALEGTLPPVEVVNVCDYGATGNGSTDDQQSILNAIAAAAGRPVHLPAGTYLLSSPLTVPDGTVLVGPTVGALAYPVSGCETPLAWLKGKVLFGSTSTFSNLRMGTTSVSTQNGGGAANTSFTRCQFRGGGGSTYNAHVVLLGWQYSCNHITFTDCNFERNVGDGTSAHNIVSVNSFHGSGSVQVDDITWDRCHIGVDNAGANTITPRAGIEVTNKGTDPAVKGWSNMLVRDCVFEKTGSFSLDFADDHNLSTGVVVRGNWFKGGGAKMDGTPFGYALCLEMPQNCLVENNLFHRSEREAIKFAYSNSKANGVVIRNNTFQLDYNNGITQATAVFYIDSERAMGMYGNTIELDYNKRVWDFWSTRNAVVYGNTVTNKYAGASPTTWAQFSTCDNVRVAGTGADATQNTLETYQTADLGFTNYPASNNTNLTLTPNILIHH